MVLGEVRAGEEEVRIAAAVQQSQQGRWTRWDEVVARRLSWSDVWKIDQARIGFLISSVYDVLPSPSNLARWHLADHPVCQLCQSRGTLRHILSACPSALGQGRYTWRHNKVLEVLVGCVIEAIRKARPTSAKSYTTRFVRAGQPPNDVKKTQTNKSSMLDGSNSWKINADLKGMECRFPVTVATSNRRPDIVVWSEDTRNVFLIELTVPWEEAMDEAHERKLERYALLQEECVSNGWRCQVRPVEVGCRGFVGTSTRTLLSAFGFGGRELNTHIRHLSDAAEAASRWLWLKRQDQWTGGRDTATSTAQ